MFLDIDGTLVEFAATPDEVCLPPTLHLLLGRIQESLDGALAILSGRTLADVDRLSMPRVFAAGGLHGAERRDARGAVVRSFASAATSSRVARACADAVRDRPDITVESKHGAAFAFHYRAAPAQEADVRELAHAIAASTDGEFVVQLGERVAELVPCGPTKGACVVAFAGEAPFAGRRPVVVGDDLTDESAFAQARELGGFGVVVGARRPTGATFALDDPAATRAWLDALARRLEPPAAPSC